MFRRFLMATVAGNFRRTGATLASQFFGALSAETAAGNTNVFYNPADLTSLRVGTDGSGGNPAVGDPVGIMMDTSQFGGKTAEDYLASQPELVTNGTFDTDTSGWTANTGFTLSFDNGGLKAAYDGSTGKFYVGASQAVTTEIGKLYEITFDVTALNNNTGRVRVEVNLGDGKILNKGSLGLGSHTYEFYASATTTYLNFSVQSNSAGSATYDNISVKEIPGHHAIAPADNARPVLYDEFDMTAAALTDNGTRTEMSAEYSAQAGTLPTGLAEGEYIIRRSSDGSQQWWYESPESIQGGNLGRTYEITYTVSDDSTEAGSQGDIETEAGRVLINTTVGTHTITAVSNRKELRFIARPGNSYKISNVSYKRVNTAFDERGPNELLLNSSDFHAFGPAWSFDNSTGLLTDISTGGGFAEYRISSGNFTGDVGVYELIFEIVSGSARVYDNAVGGYISSKGSGGLNPGTHSVMVDRTDAADAAVPFKFVSMGSGPHVIRPISAKKVPYPNLVTNGTFDTDSDWTKSGGGAPTISGGVADFANNSNGASVLEQSALTFPSQSWAKIQLYASAVGDLQVRLNGATYYLTTVIGWNTLYHRSGADTNGLRFRANFANDYTGTIDNVSVQEVPASIPRSYYLDTDGVDDWMEVKPTLNLGEQWWHVGAWRSDISAKYAFATTVSSTGGLRHGSNLWKWRNAADTGQETLINFDPATLHVLTVEQAGTNSISGRANGANSAGAITPYDDSGDTQGLALFSSQNSQFNGGIDGRFYGGSWGQEALDSDQREITEAYIASLAGITLP